MLTAQVEDYLAVLPELKAAYPDHWLELAMNREKVPLDPNYKAYERLHAADQLFLVTLRDGEKLAGYSLNFCTPSLHYGILEATSDIYRVLPEYRGRHGGVRMFREAIREAKRRGCQRFHVGAKLHKDASRLFKALGFKPVETYHSLWTGV